MKNKIKQRFNHIITHLKKFFSSIIPYLKKVNHRTYILLGLLLLSTALSIIFFTSSYPRTLESIKSFFKAFLFLFKNPDEAPLPPLPNDPLQSNITVPLSVKEFVYNFKSWAVISFNGDFFVFKSFEMLVFIMNSLKFMVFIPYILIFVILIKENIVIEEKDPIYRESKALTKYKKFENKYLQPIFDYFESWRVYLKYDAPDLYGYLFIFVFLFSYRFVAMGIDFLSFYLVFTKTFSLSQLPALLGSYLIDLISIIMEYPKITIAIPIFIFILIRRHKTAREKLKKMLEYDKKEQASHGVSNMISGPPGTGKTELMTALVFLANESLIERAFEKVKKFAKMFPDFPFPRLEAYIRDGIKSRLFVNRAQLSENIHKLYKDDQDEFIRLFDYNPKIKKSVHFDGIKYFRIDEALSIYAQAFFLYDARKPLSFANYSIGFDYIVDGHFPIYDFDTISADKERNKRKTTNISSFDAYRIYNKVGDLILNHEDDSYIMDGHVEAITEIDKERGNKISQAGQRKEEITANQLNDGFNDYIKTMRHQYTIDGTAFIINYSDTQRQYSVNADLRETNEGRLEILKRSDIKVTLPLFELDYLILGFITKTFDKYIYEFRKLRNDATLYNYLLNKLAAKAGNYLQELYNLYSYSVLSYTYRRNVTTDYQGEASNRNFYMINQITRANNYATDAYSEYFKGERLKATKGFYDAVQYKTHRASVQELDAQHSYWIDKLKNMTKTVIEDEEDTK